jgi:hypothetical protein
LARGAGLGHEDLAAHAHRLCRHGDRDGGVAARGDDDASLGNRVRAHPVEHAAGLETAADLQVLELEPQLGAFDAELAARQAQQRRAAHVAGDALPRRGNVVARDLDARGISHGESVAQPLYCSDGHASHTFCPRPRAGAHARAMNTVSRESNLELIHFVRDELARHGVTSRLTFDDSRRKANLFATVGEGKPAGVIVSGHTDTVRGTGRTGRSTRSEPTSATAASTAAAAPT